jgi:DNA-binding MarR family transcriptional regulator
VARSQSGPVRRFSAQPRSSFGYRLRETSRRLDRAISRSLANFELTVSQYHLLRELWAEQGLSVRELALRVNVAEPSTLKSLYLMQERGLVKLRTGTDDRRKRLAYLTGKGAHLEEPVLAEIERVSLDAYQDVTNADMQAALRVFHAIEERLEGEDATPADAAALSLRSTPPWR